VGGIHLTGVDGKAMASQWRLTWANAPIGCQPCEVSDLDRSAQVDTPNASYAEVVVMPRWRAVGLVWG